MAKTKKQRAEEAKAWNNWKPGSGRKGWSPFNLPIPPVRSGTLGVNGVGHPIGPGGDVDWKRVIDESNRREQRK